MIRQAPRCLLRAPIPSLRAAPTRRLLSTAPPAQKSRSWKNKATRLGLAVGVIYYYNTSTLFAEEPPFAVPPPSSPSDETSLPTLESVKSSSQKSILPPNSPPESTTEPETFEDTEQEASQEGAFNEETGEINWDCPCLGGMASGPCGEQFRAAFSCFVFSKDEPKGMDCIDHFKTMQGCFREHPDVYGAELDEDEEDAAQPSPPIDDAASPSPSPSPAPPLDPTEGPISAAARSASPEPAPPLDSTEGLIPAAARSASPEPSPSPSPSDSLASSSSAATSTRTSDTERARAAKEQVERDHGDATDGSHEMVPKAAHDATGAAVAAGK